MSDTGAQADVTPGESQLDVNAKKVDIALALHGNFRTHVQFWHDQVYKAATWSILPAYALVAYWIDLQKSDDGSFWIMVALILLIVFIWFASQRYLYLCYDAYCGNWAQIDNCQHALRLLEPNVYFKGRPFFEPIRLIPKELRQGRLLIYIQEWLAKFDPVYRLRNKWSARNEQDQPRGMRGEDVLHLARVHSVVVLFAGVVILGLYTVKLLQT